MLKIFSVLCIAVVVFITNSFSQNNNNGVLLYSQTTVGYYGSIVSSYDLFEQTVRYQVADDFIASGDWTIDQVSVLNYDYMNPRFVEGFNIYIYKNNQSKPDSLVYFAANQSYSQENGFAFIELDSPANLMGGHYWLSVQAVIDMQSNGGEVWGWVQIEGPIENEAFYKNPGSPFGPFDWSPVHNDPSSGGTDMYFEIYGTTGATGIAGTEVNPPSTFELEQNYPNPFNPSTVISYQLPVNGNVSLKVYDVLGEEVATLVDEYRPAGSYEVDFDAAGLTSGTYFYQLRAGNFVETKKMILIR